MLLHSFVIPLLTAALAVSATGLDAGTISKVRTRMLDIISHSWEYGTATEALLELEEPDVSVYGERPFPPSRTVSADSPVITIAEYVLSIKPPNTLPLMVDASAGDPASMGVAVLLASHTLQNATYSQAAADEVTFQLNVVPKAYNGAISHRVAEAQLWADNAYMNPPFLAYYGAWTSDISLILEAKTQIGLYREILRDNSTNLWHHILLGSWNDTSFWGTGNAWVAAGGTRVLQTMLRSDHAIHMISDMLELSDWMTELLSAVWTYQNSTTGAVNNHPNTNDFPDSSSTALYAAATYRLAVITGDLAMIGSAEKAFNYIAAHIDDQGMLLGSVDPLSWDTPNTQSPEGQAFVLLLQSAWRDFVAWKNSGAAPLLVQSIGGHSLSI